MASIKILAEGEGFEVSPIYNTWRGFPTKFPTRFPPEGYSGSR